MWLCRVPVVSLAFLVSGLPALAVLNRGEAHVWDSDTAYPAPPDYSKVR